MSFDLRYIIQLIVFDDKIKNFQFLKVARKF